MSFEALLDSPQYSLPQAEKESLLLAELNDLTRHHRKHCPEYDRLLSVLHPDLWEATSQAEVPFLPVGLFKSHHLLSVPEAQVFRTLTSSGTTGEQVSQIFLNHETARRQTAALSRIMTHILGPARLPMIMIETSALIHDRRSFNARAAGVLGMMNFGHHHFYVLDAEMNLDEKGLRSFLERFGRQRFLMFGFTFTVWEYFFQRIAGADLDLSQGILVHTGGWKKLEDRAVDNSKLKQQFRQQTGLTHIYNFYGMVEQVGSVCLEGEDGCLYPPNFADIIVRDPETWREAPVGTPGVIQVLSALPLSYPGHSILTEDLGVVHGIDNSTCGRRGKYFSVIGRAPRSELRGCSDTYASKVGA